MNGPLAGARVLDLTRLLPGPFCTQLLVDLGAEVVKIEDPAGGDYVRHMPPHLDDGASVLFHAVNRGKQSVALDLKTEAGRAALEKLCGSFDVLVESFRPGVLAKLGFDPEGLAARFPRLIVCSISGYGQTGPDRLRAGHDVNYVARAGALGMLAEPALPPAQIGDLAGGAWPAAFQITAALYGRERTGRGAVIDVSMTDGVHALLAMSLSRTAAGVADVGAGRDVLFGAVPCYGVYPTRDGHLTVGAIEPKFWRAFCAAADLPDLVEEQLATGDACAAAKARVVARLREKTTAEWVAIFRDADACVEPVVAPEAARADPQLAARRLTVDVEVAGKPVALTRTPLETSGARPATTAAPALGAHTEQVLRAAGVPDDVVRAVLAGG